MIGAAKEEMLSGFGPWCTDPALAASVKLGGNSRLGFATKNITRHRGIEWSKSTLALGLPEWSGKTVSGPAVAANNGPQQPQNPQQPQQPKPPQQPQQKRSTLETVCGNWNLINGSWASINFGLWLASVTPAAPAAAPTATVSSTLNAISGLGQFAVCP